MNEKYCYTQLDMSKTRTNLLYGVKYLLANLVNLIKT